MKDRILLDLRHTDMTMREVCELCEWWNDVHPITEQCFMDGDAYAIVCRQEGSR